MGHAEVWRRIQRLMDISGFTGRFGHGGGEGLTQEARRLLANDLFQ